MSGGWRFRGPGKWLGRPHQPHPLAACAVAVVLPLLTLFAILPLFGRDLTPPFFFFILPVAFAAWYAGLRYGLIALAVSALAVAYGHISDRAHWALQEPNGYLRLAGWLLVAFAVAVLLSQLRSAYQELFETSERFRLAQESARVWSWELNLDSGEILWSSPQAAVLHRGHFPILLDRVHPEDREAVERAIESALRDRAGFALEFRVVGRENEMYWVLSRGVVFESGGKATRMIGVNADITARKRAEQAKVAAATGQLAAELAHQINNPLEMLIGSLYLLETTSREQQSKIYLNAAREGAARVSQLVRELLHLYPNRQTQ